MGKTKTPRTDATLECNIPVSSGLLNVSRQLETELNEVKAKLAEYERQIKELTERAVTAELDRDWMKCQIKDGELIPVGVVREMIEQYEDEWGRQLDCSFAYHLKEFAKQKAGGE